MIRLRELVLILVVVAGAVWTFQIKHDAEESARQLSQLNRDIAEAANKIVLLEADWEILTGPARLQGVATAFEAQLGLKPLTPSQIVTLEELPPIRQAPSAEVLEAGQLDRTIITGGIEKLILQAEETQ